MMTPDRDSLDTFVAHWTASKAPKAQAFMLANVAGMTSAPLDTLELGRKPDATVMADRIEQSAAAHLAASGGKKQRYTLAVFARDQKVLAQHFFTLEAEVNTLTLMAPGMANAMGQFDELDDDGLTPSGAFTRVVAKHQQEMTKIYMGGFGALMMHLSQQVDRMGRRTAAIEGRHLEAMKLCEELLNRKHERELELEEHKSELSREERAWGSFEKFLPIIAARMTGATDLSDLFRSLSVEKRGQLFATLDDEQAQTLRRIFSQDDEARQAIDELLNRRQIEAQAPAAE